MNLTKRLSVLLPILLLCVSSALTQHNVVKISPLKLAIRTFAISYEHTFTDKIAVGLGTNFFLRTDFNEGLAGSISNLDTTGNFSSTAINLNGFTFTPEFRYYPGGKAPQGFFLDPFVRFLQYKTAVDAVFNDNAEVSNIESNFRFRALGPGFSLGYQWIIAERFSIEWHGGLGITFGAVSHTGTILNGPIQNDIQKYVDELNLYIQEEIPFIDQEISLEDINTLKFRIPGVTWPVFRSGLSFGVAF
ncbi:MAG: DUF3575 domain-containing protein [Bacteroidota bacterium]